MIASNDRSPEFAALDASARFLVWGTEDQGPRSKVFARKLGIEPDFIAGSFERRGWNAPLRYASRAIATIRLMRRERPDVVFTQSPPSLLPVVVMLHQALTQGSFVVDAHSTALQKWYWLRPRWLHRIVTRRALAVIVTNEAFARQIGAAGGRALVVPDLPTEFPAGGTFETDETFNIAVVSTFAADEPIDEIVAAARTLPGATFHVTGRTDRAPARLVESAPHNVSFTGYLDDPDYFTLLRTVDAVMCLTTRDNTMQRGACEALSLGTPIITSDWPLLREYFSQGTVHVDNSVAGIRAGVERMRSTIGAQRSAIRDLQLTQRALWEDAAKQLVAVVNGRHEGASQVSTIRREHQR